MAKKRISMDDMCGGALLQRFNMEMGTGEPDCLPVPTK